MLKELNQAELRSKLSEKVSEIHELIEQIDEQTEFEAYGTILYGVENNDEVHAGGSLYGSAIDIARIINNSDELDDVQSAIVAISLGALEEDDI